ncbi:thiamine transporter 2-like [Adelges cooleyi]|uniref:thiamine transporter 2-like n=1 Tax=Adelges cooleyi TaxID=133065 RepID=UPI00218085B4|nr:thiamine transporter 2-like [Adelges cooleyi]
MEEQWKKITIMTTVYAFALEIRPLDPFLAAYLTGPDIKMSLQEVTDRLTPFRVYSSVIGTGLGFFLTDYLRYKPVMVFNGIIGVLAYVNFIGSPDMVQLLIASNCLSLFLSVEITYFSYLYAQISNKNHYQLATGYAKAGCLSGACISGLVGQLIVFSGNGNYTALPYISLAAMAVALVWACFLPPVEYSNYFNLADDEPVITSKTALYDASITNYTESSSADKQEHRRLAASPFKRIYHDFRVSYRDPAVLKWSIWYTLALAIFIEITLNINILFSYLADMRGNRTPLLNGLVVSVATMCGALSTYSIGQTTAVDWNVWGDLFFGCGSIALGVLTGLCYFSSDTYAYFMYISYYALAQTMFVIAISEIAKRMKATCYGLVLGFNAFAALCLAACFSMFVIQMNVFDTTTPGQFLFYGGTYLTLGIIFLGVCVLKMFQILD